MDRDSVKSGGGRHSGRGGVYRASRNRNKTLTSQVLAVAKALCRTTPWPGTSISDLAERLDVHRRSVLNGRDSSGPQQAAHPQLTLTGIDNVLEKPRREQPLDAKGKVIHEQGLVAVLARLHGELDAVLAACGWADLATAPTTAPWRSGGLSQALPMIRQLPVPGCG